MADRIPTGFYAWDIWRVKPVKPTASNEDKLEDELMIINRISARSRFLLIFQEEKGQTAGNCTKVGISVESIEVTGITEHDAGT